MLKPLFFSTHFFLHLYKVTLPHDGKPLRCTLPDKSGKGNVRMSLEMPRPKGGPKWGRVNGEPQPEWFDSFGFLLLPFCWLGLVVGGFEPLGNTRPPHLQTTGLQWQGRRAMACL